MCLESRERDFLPSNFETHCYLRTFLQCLSICRQHFSELGLAKINCTLWCHGLAKWNHLYVVRAAQCSNVCRKGSEVLGTGSTGCLLPPVPRPPPSTPVRLVVETTPPENMWEWFRRSAALSLGVSTLFPPSLLHFGRGEAITDREYVETELCLWHLVLEGPFGRDRKKTWSPAASVFELEKETCVVRGV